MINDHLCGSHLPPSLNTAPQLNQGKPPVEILYVLASFVHSITVCRTHNIHKRSRELAQWGSSENRTRKHLHLHLLCHHNINLLAMYHTHRIQFNHNPSLAPESLPLLKLCGLHQILISWSNHLSFLAPELLSHLLRNTQRSLHTPIDRCLLVHSFHIDLKREVKLINHYPLPALNRQATSLLNYFHSIPSILCKDHLHCVSEEIPYKDSVQPRFVEELGLTLLNRW